MSPETIYKEVCAEMEEDLQNKVQKTSRNDEQSRYSKSMKNQSVKFYQVGGCVRDMLMGLKSKDIDYSVEAPSYEAMRAAIVERCGSEEAIKVEKPEYATIRAVDPKLGGVDFVLCRKDGAYSDGRRPDSTSIGTLYDDLARRDFTCNAIALEDNGTYHDFFGGATDIDLKIIKCVGGVDRLREDSLRMLRAIRFSITKGFSLHDSIIYFLQFSQNAELLKNISLERIREELNKCFAHDTFETFRTLNHYPFISKVIFSDMGLGLDATMKKK